MVRNQRSEERYSAITQSRKNEEMDKYASTGGMKPRYQPKYGKQKEMLTATQIHANEDIHKRMTHKLNYMRNPRNVDSSVDRVLTKTNGRELKFLQANNFMPKNMQRGEVSPENGNEALPPRPASPDEYENEKASRPSKSEKNKDQGVLGGIDANSATSMGTSALNSPSRYSETSSASAGVGALFAADPVEIIFDTYEVGVPVSLPISFRNISAISRMVRVIPPITADFTLSPLQYPTNSKGGLIAPGMSVSGYVSFYPESLADCGDCLSVETEGGCFDVAITAQRDCPKLSLTPDLNVGTCMVGDAMRVQLFCQNTGGMGKFRLVGQNSFDVDQGVVTEELDWDTLGCLRMEPFTVYPVKFELEKMESVNVIVEFVPLELSDHFTHKFYILSDNLQVFEYTLHASSKQVDVSISEINASSFDAKAPSIRREVFFEAANIGIEQSQQIVVSNDSGLPIEYEWVWLESPQGSQGAAARHVDEAELTKLGRKKIENTVQGANLGRSMVGGGAGFEATAFNNEFATDIGGNNNNNNNDGNMGKANNNQGDNDNNNSPGGDSPGVGSGSHRVLSGTPKNEQQRNVAIGNVGGTFEISPGKFDKS